MQFSYPGFQKCPPAYNYNTPFQCNGFPDIIGEGHVTSVLSPDGSVQYLFFPTAHWWRPQPFNQIQNNRWNEVGAWFVKDIYNPIPPMYSPPYQTPCGLPFPTPIASSCIELPANNYQLKFHNDCATSTSDIHYFYPHLRSSSWCQKPKSSSAVQVAAPMTSSSCQHQVSNNNKTCMCSPEKYKKQEVVCICCNSESSVSKMSISESDFDCQKRKEKSKHKKTQEKKSKHMKTCNQCGCRKAQRDNSVTTGSEQTVNCREEGRNAKIKPDTLHKINTEPKNNDSKTEILIPMKPRAKRLLKITSVQHVPCESTTTCTSLACSCNDTDCYEYTDYEKLYKENN